MSNYSLLREIDPHRNNLKFANKLDCVVDRSSGQLKGYYNSTFGPFMWSLPLNIYDLSTEPEYWYVIVTYGLLNGQIFDKFSVLKNKWVIDPATLNLESILSNNKLFKIASAIKAHGLVSKQLLEDKNYEYKNVLLDLLKASFTEKVDKAYAKLFK